MLILFGGRLNLLPRAGGGEFEARGKG